MSELPLRSRTNWYHAPLFAVVDAAVRHGKWPSEYDPAIAPDEDKALVMAYYRARGRMQAWEEQEAERKAKARERAARLGRLRAPRRRGRR